MQQRANLRRKSAKVALEFDLNGSPVVALVAGHERLIDVLRDTLGQHGTKEGCSEGECGACTVLVDGAAINSCLYPAFEVEGREVTTVEGLTRTNSQLSPVQQAFVEEGGVQCGFCTAGILMMTVALLERNPNPTEREVREALTGNLCRCTGYTQIVASVMRAAELCREGAAQ